MPAGRDERWRHNQSRCRLSRIVTEFAKEGIAAEAKVRLSELTKGTVS